MAEKNPGRDVRIAAVQRRLRELANELLELADEVALASGEAPSAGQEAKRLLDLYVSLWHQRYKGRRYVVHNGGKLINLLKALLRSTKPGDLEGRMARFLDSADPFYVQARHPLEMFCAAVNKFAAVEREDGGLLDQVDWFEECKEKHGGACNGSHAHELKMYIDRARAGKEPVL